ncbi:MAG: hypothetical protein CMO44_06345 [Verrucomicrobiales bacterium]|nr:hypothetical protein [Verrucomicrobiales bacterium]
MNFFLALICILFSANVTSVHAELRAGAAKVDVTPTFLPVIRNGGFLEATDNKVNDLLHARCLVLDDRVTRLAIVVVDSCMLPIDLCDEAKRLASEKTGIPVNCILISATHSHSAPSAMNYCLGTRADPRYRNFLPSKIANSIIAANTKLEPAKAAWDRVDAAEFTACRRWSFIRGQELTDPFGGKSVRANMHPGYRNVNAVGPTGPDDPWLSFLSVQTLDGQPLAVLGNFSMHYFSGHSGVSSDFAGAFSEVLAERVAKNKSGFVGIMSQGTSGDLWWGDYSLDQAQSWSMKSYVNQLVELVADRLTDHEHKTDIPLGFAESRIELFRRTPDAGRLKWAQDLLEKMKGRRPSNRPEVYAEQAYWISKNPLEEVTLQAVRIGELGITAIPCEVYGLTGLKLKSASPFPLTFNISLANGASGYIPPVEQHLLGGYTTWPARTAGLEVNAESRIVEEVTRLLEQTHGKPRKIYTEPDSSFSKAVLTAKPMAYWRLGEQRGSVASDSSGNKNHALYQNGVGFHLPGLKHSNQIEDHTSRAVHFAGGRVEATVPFAQSFTVQFWLWSGIIKTNEPVNNHLAELNGLNLNLINTKNDGQSKLITKFKRVDIAGIKPRCWNLVTLVSNPNGNEIWLNDVRHIDFKNDILTSDNTKEMRLVFGGTSDGKADFHGKLDEIAFFDRALTSKQIKTLYNSSIP